jgi:hypothetical protein
MNGVFGSKITGSLNSNAVLRNKLVEIAEIVESVESVFQGTGQESTATRFPIHFASRLDCIA